MTVRLAGPTALAGALLLTACAQAGAGTLLQAGSPPASPPPSSVHSVAVASEPAAAVEAVVRAYLEADSQRDYARMASIATGSIKQYWQWYDMELGSCTCPVESLTIDHIRVTSLSGRQAAVDVLATLQAADHTTSIAGPMRLVKTVGWYIADYRRNGVDFANTIAPRHGGVVSAGHIDVQVIGVDRQGPGEDVWFKVTNSRPTDVGLVAFDAFASSVSLQRSEWRPNISDLMANRYFVTQIMWLAPATLEPGTPLHVHLVFRDLSNGEQISIDVTTAS